MCVCPRLFHMPHVHQRHGSIKRARKVMLVTLLVDIVSSEYWFRNEISNSPSVSRSGSLDFG